MNKLRDGLVAAAALAIGALANPAAASTVVTSVGLVDGYTAVLTDSAFPLGAKVHLSPYVLNGKLDVFCVDPYHKIATGAVNYLYNPGALATNSNGALTGTGAALTATQVGEIGGLVHLGYADLASNDKIGASAAQGAIWEILGATVAPYGTSAPTLTADIAADLIWAVNPANQVAIGAIYDQRDNVQGFNGVPEPAAWSMMVVGLALLGAGLRLRRKSPSAT